MSEDELPPADLTKEQMVELLKADVGKWNRWREANREVPLDLRESNLSGANLSRAGLGGAILVEAVLHLARISAHKSDRR